VKLLIDEMWEQELARQLRLRGYDVVSVHEREDLAAKSDDVVFAAAQAEGRVVVTENRGDFRRLAQQMFSGGRSHCGLIFSSTRALSRHRRGALGRVVTALSAMLDEDRDLTNREIWLS
jgi:predicted nuclease of predicted toxin-antitoxin system